MFKKFNYQLNHSPVGMIWGLSFAILLSCLFILSIGGEFIIPRKEIITDLLGYVTILNFLIATYILLNGEIKQVNVICVSDC